MHLGRRTFVVGMGAAVAWPATLLAQSPAAMRRVGLLSTPEAAISPELVVFRDALRERGFVEKRNLAIQYGSAEELVGAGVEAIVATGTFGLNAARAATWNIPLVIVDVADLDGGGNVTGIRYDPAMLSAKLVEIMPQVVPGASSLAVLRNPASANGARQMKAADAAARVIGVYAQAIDVGGPDLFEGAFTAMKRRGLQGVVILDDPMFTDNAARLAELSLQAGLPSIHDDRAYAAAGGLMSYGPAPAQSWRLAAAFVDQILHGAQPADLPVEESAQFEFVLNAGTAKKLGLVIPANALKRAHKVIS